VVGSPLQAVGYPSAPVAPPLPKPNFTPAAQAAASSARGRQNGFDVVMLMLGLVAIIAVIGLIPLFVAVYRAYLPSFGGNRALPTALPTLQPGQVRVPDLVGQEEAAARAGLQELGLEMVVEGEEAHPTYPAFTIVRQTVAAGSAVDLGSAVGVVLSQGPPLIELPDVTGKSFDEAEQLLTSYDLIVQKYEDWSAELPGTVVTQDPPPGSVVSNRSLVTLLVSSGARIPVGANLGGQIVLTAYEIPRLQYKAGEPIGLTFFWQAVAPPAADYMLFIHLTTPQGGIVSQIDAPPLGGIRPTSQWQVGEMMVDSYQLPIPPTTIPGDYQLRVGFYEPNSNVRLPILEPGRAEADNFGALLLRRIQVVE
jgi:serine/threonine-protein kinase